jgi:hypothetical protein
MWNAFWVCRENMGVISLIGSAHLSNMRALVSAIQSTVACFVSENTVTSIYVELEVEMRFSTLKIDKKKYKKYISPQNPALATYSNDEEGIIYTVEDDDVTAIEYLPTAKDCQDVMRRAKPAGVQSSRRKTRCVGLLKSFLIAALFALHDER